MNPISAASTPIFYGTNCRYTKTTFAALLLLIYGLWLTSSEAAETISVGTIERPPFSYHNKDGELTGFSVELWEQIARQLNEPFNWTSHDQFSNMVDSVASGTTDLAIANISITSVREQIADFTQPIFESGMAIGVKQGQSGNIIRLIWESGMLLFLGGALLLVFLVANVIWFFERGIENARHDYFRDGYLGGVWDAFWWAFVIMTMGGFEKEVPHKIISRLLAMFWIVASLFFISTLTAKITTALTVAELRTGIENYRDLKGKRVGVTSGSSHEQFLTTHDIKSVGFPTLTELYSALKNEQLDAIVADHPVLSYYAQRDGAGWLLLAGERFNPENYGILLPERSPLLEPINRILLKMKENGQYQKLHSRYFGGD